VEIKPDILGLTAKTPDIRECEKLACKMKSIKSSIKVIVGGAHVTGIRKRVLEECDWFDFGIYGEGEITFCELLDHFKKDNKPISEIDGLIHRDGDRIIENRPRKFISDLNSLLFPAWHLFPRGTDLPLFTSRGCPFKCIFCQRVMGNSARTMSPYRVIQEMEWNIREFGTTFFQIEDETFGLNREWTENFLDLIIQRGLNKRVTWFANSRVNIANLEIYRKMQRAGCVGLGFGIESGNQQILDIINKGFNLEDAKKAINLAKQAGLETHVFFILGHPFETKKTIRDTINFACKLNPYDVAFGIMIPYPGTKISEMAKENKGGYIGLSENWEKYTKYFGGVLEFENLKKSTLNWYQKKAYLKFCIRNFKSKKIYKKIKLYFSKQS
ncbi:MAG: B12-binding domain-containing radical SAM protein, partial [Candidatus Hodarchaeota archaeon]